MEKLNLNPSPRIEPVGENQAVEHALTAAKGGALFLPFLGPGTAFVDLVTRPLLTMRLGKLYEEIRVRVNDLSRDGLTWEKLENNERFSTAVMQASAAAAKTHQQEKLEALRNAVVNVALGKEADSNWQQPFLARRADAAGIKTKIGCHTFRATGITRANEPCHAPLSKMPASQNAP